jgi:hypothetical protein
MELYAPSLTIPSNVIPSIGTEKEVLLNRKVLSYRKVSYREVPSDDEQKRKAGASIHSSWFVRE